MSKALRESVFERLEIYKNRCEISTAPTGDAQSWDESPVDASDAKMFVGRFVIGSFTCVTASYTLW